ncbi:MAG: LOG family protein [Acidobacteriota bacterium]
MSDSDHQSPPPVAYLNEEFLKSSEARPIRILSEYLEPAARLRHYKVRDTIVFFGSARSVSPQEAAKLKEEVEAKIKQTAALTAELESERRRADQLLRLARYYDDAMELARRITEWSKGLTTGRHFIICSGGSGGMMEAANRGASVARGKTIGLNIMLPFEQKINPYVSREFIFNFHYFFMRKLWFVYPAKALVVFPGGFGTMDELFEVLTLIQTRMPSKTMPVVLFGKEFWDDIIDFDALVRWGVVSPHDLDIFYKTDTVDDAFQYLTTRLEELYMKKGLEEVKLT